MTYQQIIYEPGAVARIILNRPAVNNAQSRQLLEEMDDAFEAANADGGVQVVVFSGTGRNFSAGHDLGSEAELIDRGERGYETERPGSYDRLRDLNVTNTLRWRNFPKPTIAMVQGYCIYGGWMIASAMDVIFASDEARFLPAHNQYFGVPWDLGARKTKELLFQNRLLTAQEAEAVGFVNRVYRPEDLERETLAYAAEVATTNPMHNRQVKFSVNNMLCPGLHDARHGGVPDLCDERGRHGPGDGQFARGGRVAAAGGRGRGAGQAQAGSHRLQ